MKKTIFCSVIITFIILGFLSSCVSFGVGVVNDPAKTCVIINYVDGATSQGPVNVFIDGKKIGIIQLNEIKGYRLANGHHTLHFTRMYKEWSGAKESRFTRSETFRFISDYDRQYFGLRAYGPNLISYNYNTESVISKNNNVHPQSPSQDIIVSQIPTQNVNPIREEAIVESFNIINPFIPEGVKIAIVNIFPNNDVGNNTREELTVLFVNSKKYIIVDRQSLEIIRQEQNFQMSDEVNDFSAVSIGQFLGADIVITGNISGDGDQRRLRLRVLDVKTAQLLAMSSERI